MSERFDQKKKRGQEQYNNWSANQIDSRADHHMNNALDDGIDMQNRRFSSRLRTVVKETIRLTATEITGIAMIGAGAFALAENPALGIGLMGSGVAVSAYGFYRPIHMIIQGLNRVDQPSEFAVASLQKASGLNKQAQKLRNQK